MAPLQGCDHLSELKFCSICGLPVAVMSTWTLRNPGQVTASGVTPREDVEMVQTACYGGHWYGGRLSDVLVDSDSRKCSTCGKPAVQIWMQAHEPGCKEGRVKPTIIEYGYRDEDEE